MMPRIMLRFSTIPERLRLFLCLLQAVLLLAITPSRAAPHMMHHATAPAMATMHAMDSVRECCTTHAPPPVSLHAETPHTPKGHCGNCAHIACDTNTAFLPVTARITGPFLTYRQSPTSLHTVPPGSPARPDLPPPRPQTV
ncbi:hypothetical protein [Neokomagataea thailandica]|uniref:hypothetical protein n=1 Tax=Neokomagataea TaxID=1223423 RepID=UPI0012ED1F2A|nr:MULTISPECIES: hypothetical protein [Neokomagataea]